MMGKYLVVHLALPCEVIIACLLVYSIQTPFLGYNAKTQMLTLLFCLKAFCAVT